MRAGILLLCTITAWACGSTPQVQDIAQPAPSEEPKTLEARAEICGKAIKITPTDHAAHRCWLDAMVRLGRRAELIDTLTKAREAEPDQELRWYFEGRARMGIAPDAAFRVFNDCHSRLENNAWCIYGLSLIHAQFGAMPHALELLERIRGQIPDAELQTHHARILAATGQLATALTTATAAVDADPTLAEAHATLGQIFLTHNNLNAAEAAFEQARILAPDSAIPHYLKARLDLIRGNHSSALTHLRAAVAADPDDERSRHTLAQLLMRLGDHDAALDHLQLLVDQHPQKVAHMVALGESLLATGATKRALGWANLALSIEPNDLNALTLLTRATLRQGDLKAALALRPQIYQGTQAPKRRLLIAHDLARLGYPARAESEFAAAIDAHPQHVSIWRAYAQWHHDHRRFMRAAVLLQRALETLPKSAAIHADLSEILEQVDDLPGARKAMAQAVKLAPFEPDYVDDLARLEFLSGQVESALKRWETLILMNRRADRAMIRLAHAYRALGRTAKAVVFLRRLVDTHPQDAHLRRRLGEALLINGEKTEAIEVLRKALNDGADPKRAQPLLATALADTGDDTGAEAAFRAALKADPASRPLRMTFAMFLEVRGNRAGAVDLYTAQLARDPADKEVRARLKALLGDSALIDTQHWPAANVDPVLRALADRAPAPSGRQLATVLRDVRHVFIDDQGVARIRHLRSVLLQRPYAHRRYDEVAISFHATHAPKVIRARTIDPEGNVHSLTADEQSIRDPYANTPLHGDARSLILKFNDLQPGSIIDYEVETYRPHPDLPDVWWDGYVLANIDPTVQATYSLTSQVGLKPQISAPGMGPPAQKRDGELLTRTWSRQNLPGFDLKNGTGPVPAIYSTNLRTWRAVNQWYASLFIPQTNPDDTIRDQTLALTADLKSTTEKIAAIYRFVDHEIAYLGIEFGISAYQPHSAKYTLQAREGDCKDKTALMVAMLKIIGVTANAALIRPRGHGAFVEGHPSPGQFSHVLLYIPKQKGVNALWLDATAGLGTIDAIPTVLRGRRALVIDRKGGKLLNVPEAKARAHRLSEQLRFDLTLSGGGQLHSTLSLTGDIAGQARRQLLAIDPQGRESLLRSPGYLLGGGRTPAHVGLSGLSTPTDPLTLSADLEDPDLVAVRYDGALVIPVKVALLQQSPLPALGPQTVIGSRRIIERRLQLHPPKGYTFDWPRLAHQAKVGGIQIQIKEHRKPHVTEIVTRMEITDPRSVTPPMVRRAFATASAQLTTDLVMRPGKTFDRLAFLQAIAAEQPDNPQLHLMLGQALLKASRFNEAAKTLERAKLLIPKNPKVLALLAAALIKSDDPAHAEGPLRRLAAQDNTPPSVYLTLASVLINNKKPSEAASTLRTALKHHPKHPEIGRHLINALEIAGDHQAALTEATEQTKSRPEDAETHAVLGDVASTGGHLKIAEQAYRQTLLLQPDHARALNNLAWLLRDRPGQLPNALQMAERAAQLDPQSDATWDTLSELRFRSGDIDGAIQANDQAQRLNPSRKALYDQRRARYEAAR